MCGICGLADFSDSRVSPDRLSAMVDTLVHRGPDDRGHVVLGKAGLGHTRLSIIDLTAAGHQPMSTDDGSISLVYNGEIYNFRELRVELEREGFRFVGRSDTEVVLRAYEHWGTGCLARLKGMFALAIWDARDEKLILARDRFGIKPLYYHLTTSGIVFGSEVKALFASSLVPRDLSWPGLHEYLYYGNALGETTLFDGVRRLLPGHYFEITQDGGADRVYWRLEDVPAVAENIEENVETVAELLEAAVRSHLVSDVPVAVFLSGGVDSSAVTAFASRHYEGHLKTFSVGFDFDGGVNELPKAKRVAEHYGTDHHELHLKADNVPELLDRLVRCHDEPFADPANIPLFLLCRELSGSVKVVLQGDGGDEMFGGYRRYNLLSRQAWLRAALWPFAPGRLPLPAGPRLDRVRRMAQVFANRDPALRMAYLLTLATGETPPTDVLSRQARDRLLASDPFARYRDAQRRFGDHGTVQRMLYTDTTILLPDTFLEKVDKPTMAHGIEVRVPFLDVDLSRYALGLPDQVKVRAGQKKWLLRRALRKIVPDDILDGPKTGFTVPYAEWLGGPLADYMKQVLLDPSMIAWGILDGVALERTIDEHRAGKRNHGHILYKLLNLALWRNAYLRGEP